MQKDKFCIELKFDRTISYSQRIKVRDFWKFVDDTNPLEPYEVISEEKLPKKEDQELYKCKRKWYNQLKVFQEHGLDKVALAAVEECKPCYDHSNYTNPEFCDTMEESYDELSKDMKTFDKRLNDNVHPKLARKKSTIPCTN